MATLLFGLSWVQLSAAAVCVWYVKRRVLSRFIEKQSFPVRTAAAVVSCLPVVGQAVFVAGTVDLAIETVGSPTGVTVIRAGSYVLRVTGEAVASLVSHTGSRSLDTGAAPDEQPIESDWVLLDEEEPSTIAVMEQECDKEDELTAIRSRLSPESLTHLADSFTAVAPTTTHSAETPLSGSIEVIDVATSQVITTLENKEQISNTLKAIAHEQI